MNEKIYEEQVIVAHNMELYGGSFAQNLGRIPVLMFSQTVQIKL